VDKNQHRKFRVISLLAISYPRMVEPKFKTKKERSLKMMMMKGKIEEATFEKKYI